MSLNRFTTDEQREIIQTILKHIYTLGIVDFFFKIKPYKKNYFLSTGITLLFFITFFKFPLWTIFLPLIPYAILLLFYLVDMNVMVYTLTKAHSELIERGYKIDWNTLLDFVYEMFKSDSY